MQQFCNTTLALLYLSKSSNMIWSIFHGWVYEERGLHTTEDSDKCID